MSEPTLRRAVKEDVPEIRALVQRAHAKWLAVTPRLMRHAEDLARAAGLLGTRLYTNRLMVENIALYAGLGYAHEKETDHGGGMVAVHMVRTFGS